jgi:nicotinate-nucleotide--dimethylbenzimidazole phosphoribosyltransferase
MSAPDPIGLATGLQEALARLAPPDAQAVRDATERQQRLTKPPGALGVLESISIRLAGLAGRCPPPIPAPAAVAVFAADHGVHAQRVSPWPQEVTAQMVANFLAGGAAVNALAGQVGAEVFVVDVGVASALDPASAGSPLLLARRVRAGTRDLSVDAAMTSQEVLAALDTGVAVAADLIGRGHRCLLTGDMGIANTTASAALIAAFTGTASIAVTGRGTGVDDATLGHKIEVIERAMVRHADVVARRDQDPIAVLAALGGLEHAAIAGLIIGAAAARIPVLLDGVIAGSAALAARAIAPAAMAAVFAGHRSTEPGHAIALAALGLRPLIDLDLRLGEGTGALLALPGLRSAAAALAQMATFDSAGVSGEDGAPADGADRGDRADRAAGTAPGPP